MLKLTQSRTFPGSSGTSAARPSSQLGPQSHWLRWSLIAVLLATLGVASYLGYNYHVRDGEITSDEPVLDQRIALRSPTSAGAPESEVAAR